MLECRDSLRQSELDEIGGRVNAQLAGNVGLVELYRLH